MTISRRPRLILTVSLGQLIASGLSGLTLFTLVWNIAVVQTHMQIDIDAAKSRAVTYVPLVDKLVQDNRVQDERLANQGKALTELSTGLTKISDRITQMAIDTAEIKAQLKARGQ